MIYELHVGTFSAEGTFDGAIPYLAALRELGITAIELMPVATFPGNRDWGYDGVFAYAPHPAYGGPEGLARLVDAAHREGLGVILDVVYNHLGPGAEFTALGPWFTDRHETPWGDALDFSQPPVREWAIGNALQWTRDYGIDGLRLDAVFAIHDDAEPHVLRELADRMHEAKPGALVIAEEEVGNEEPIREWGHDAQWADELHHELHVLLTGETDGYYEGYGSVGRPRPPARAAAGRAARRLRAEPRPGREPRVRRPAGARRAPGARLDAPVRAADAADLHGRGVRRAGAVPLLHRPRRPRDRRGDAAGPEARVRALRARIPDPQALETFEASKLTREEVPGIRELYRDLLALRRELPQEIETEPDDEARTLRARRGGARARGRLPLEGGELSEMTESGPAARSRSARSGTGRARTSRSSPSTPSASSSASSTPTTARRGSSWASARRSTGTATSRASGPASATASASTARTSRRRASASTRPSCCIDPYAKAIEGPIGYDRANPLPYVPGGDEDADLELDDEDDAEAIPKCVVIDQGFDWEGVDKPRHALARDGDLRGARQGLHEAPSRRAARTCAAPTPASPPTTRSRTCRSSA